MANFWEQDPVATADFWAKDNVVQQPKSTDFWSKDEVIKSQEPIDFSIPTERALRTSSVTPTQEPSALSQLTYGAAEVPTAIAGSIVGGLGGVVNRVLRGTASLDNTGFEEGAQYVAPVTAPQTEAGRAALENFGEFSDRYLTPLGGMGELGALARLRPVSGMPSTFRASELPVVGKTLERAGQVAESVTAPIVENIKGTFQKSPEAKAKQYNQVIDNYELEAADAMSKGMAIDDIKPFVLSKLGIPEQRLTQATNYLKRNVEIPATMEEANLVSRIKAAGEYKDPSVMSKILQPIQSRLQTIAEPVANRLGKYEFNLHTNTAKYIDEATPFLTSLNRLDKPVAEKISLDLYNGNFDNVRSTLQQTDPALISAFNKTESVLKDIYQQLVDSGYKDLAKIENYFPRRIKDLDGLYKELGVPAKGKIETLLNDKANKLNISRTELTDEQVADAVNKYLRGYGQKTSSGKPYFTKSRNIDQVDPRILPYYDNPATSFQNYVRSAVNNIEKNKFFGKSAVVDAGQKLNIDSSIGNFIAQDIGGTSPAADEISALLKARFSLGEQSPNAIVKAAKNIMYSSTIANFKSSVSQIADLGMSAFVNGSRNSIAAMLKSKEVTMHDLGLAEASAELSTAEGTSKALNSLLTISQFKRIDKLGKETFINAALSKARKMSQSETGTNALKNRYGKVFGEEFNSFTNDLKSGKITDNVKYYLFNELAEVQPINLSQMPKMYLENPNGRVLYALKSFTIKQLDVMKKHIYDQYKAGNKGRAVKNAAAYVALIGGANTSADQFKKIMEGKEINVDDLPQEFAFNVLKLFGGSKFLYDKYLQQGKFGEAAIKTIAPPLDVLTAPVEDAIGYLSGKENYQYKTPKKLPLVGWAIYNWFGGGLEKYNTEQENKLYK